MYQEGRPLQIREAWNKGTARTHWVEGFMALLHSASSALTLPSRAVGQLEGGELIHCSRMTSKSTVCMETVVYTVVVQAQKQTRTCLRTSPLKVLSVDQRERKYLEVG